MKVKNCYIFIGFFLLSMITILTGSGEVVTRSKEYNAVNDSSIVSTRELALLAALVYEDVPNDANYNTTNLGQGCIDSNGNLKSNCFYKAYTEKVKSSREGNPLVYRYIEGMSESKRISPVSSLTLSLQEDGEKYYFLNYASAAEMAKVGWTIYDYKDEKTVGPIKSFLQENFKLTTEEFKAVFSAITFKKGNNYVIAYRGTDFPDLFEWVDNFAYALNGEHAEASLAYLYAQEVYNKIVASNPKAKIYVTGHSLGAYLAQVGGAAIVDLEAGRDYTKLFQNNLDSKEITNTIKKYLKSNNFTSIGQYTEHYKNNKGKSSHLVQVGYFNGMGVGGLIGRDSKLVDNVQDALFYLSTHDKNGQVAKGDRTVNYSNENGLKSSGRLVLYSMDEDPISYIGFHYGEIYKLEPGADSITNHRGNHNFSAKILAATAEDIIKRSLEDTVNIIEKMFGTETKASDEYIFATMVAKYFEDLGSLNFVFENAAEKVQVSNPSDNSPKMNYPAIVASEVKSVYKVDIKNINVISMIKNLLSGGIGYIDRLGLVKGKSDLAGVIDFFNINHETDSFACIIDKGAGSITEVGLSISTADSTITCDSNNNCYYKNLYSSLTYEYDVKKDGMGTRTANYIKKLNANNIVLQANVSNACAKSYTWQYSEDGKNWKTYATTTDNKFMIPRDLITSASVSYKFRVLASYGDVFQETKTYFEDNGLLKIGHGNSRKTSYNANPTLSEGLKVSQNITKNKKTSNVLSLSIIRDNDDPVCTTNTTVDVKLSCSWFKCNEQTVNPTVSCSDSGSGIKSVKVKTFKVEQGGLALIPIIKKAADNATVTENTATFPVIITRKPTFLKPKLIVKVEAIDNIGNNITFDKNINFNISK